MLQEPLSAGGAFQPLSGVTVVEAASYVSGPFAAMMLADLGARVTKVEPPGGDPYRRFGRAVQGTGIMFANVNRNKRSEVVDLKADSGRRRLRALVAEADVFLTNWRPGVAEELGFDESSLRSLNPRLVWCRVSGFGQDGPLAGAPAFDTVIQARVGLMSVQGGAGSPDSVRGYLVDKVTASFAAQAIMAALLQRASTGEGGVVDVSMLDAIAYFMGPELLAERTRLEDGEGRPALAEQLTALRCVQTSDGWVLVSPVRAKQLKGMAAAAGHPEWVDELRGEADPGRRTARIYDLVAGVTPSATTADWLERFEEHDVPAAPVLDIDEHLADPQVEHNRTYVYYDHPALGRIRQPRHPTRRPGASDQPDPSPSPALDE
ncbi:MAG TPA: CoA transferase [Acidimicrobiales bacterium]|nr:CoA transferase [Acidimicrobiales bacterium]